MDITHVTTMFVRRLSAFPTGRVPAGQANWKSQRNLIGWRVGKNPGRLVKV